MNKKSSMSFESKFTVEKSRMWLGRAGRQSLDLVKSGENRGGEDDFSGMIV
jgi:hypothetical protein